MCRSDIHTLPGISPQHSMHALRSNRDNGPLFGTGVAKKIVIAAAPAPLATASRTSVYARSIRSGTRELRHARISWWRGTF